MSDCLLSLHEDALFSIYGDNIQHPSLVNTCLSLLVEFRMFIKCLMLSITASQEFFRFQLKCAVPVEVEIVKQFTFKGENISSPALIVCCV